MSNRLNQNYDRRDFIKLAGTAIIGGFALTACGKAPSSSVNGSEITPPPQEPTPEGRVVLIDDIEVNVDQVEMPYLYEDRPWADPENDVELTKEQRTENSAIEITDKNQVKEGMSDDELEAANEQITLEIGRMLERIANAGRSPGERAEAEELGLSWEEYIREYYMDPMFDGLFSVKYEDPRFAGADEALKDFFMEFVDEYETALRHKEARSNVTMFISTEFIEQQDGLISTDRSLFIGIETTRPAMTRNHEPVIYRGHITVNVDEGADGKYDIGIQAVTLDRQ